MKYKKLHLLTLAGLLWLGCNEQGLNPNEVTEPGFGGTITYVSKIPADSLQDLRIVAVPYLPVDTSFGEILAKILNRVIAFSDDITLTADSGRVAEYRLLVKPQTYYYVAVVQQFGSNPFMDWRVVSVYGYSPSTPNPKTVVVRDAEFTEQVNFIVDFYNLPPQPF